jgi:signal transduction histidine kinase/CheY-like chemotaxis protein/HPt (histidine-containing phosphotransfer) domain-containing protein
MAPFLQGFLLQQGYVLCEYHGGGELSLLSAAPDWFGWIWGSADSQKNTLRLGDKSPFLQGFLADATAFWDSRKGGALESGPWIETLRDEIGTPHEIALQALASSIGSKRVISIQNRAEGFAEQTRILQTARDGLLVHERLLKEIQKKEILLHCIIHDLSQPLTAIRGCFEILALEEGSARARQVVEVGKQQTEQQEEMIREVLQAFSADLQGSIEAGVGAQALPNLLTCAAETVAAFTPTFEAKGMTVTLDPRLQGHTGWKVMAESTRLKRIFSNLAENALRYAPAGSTVTLGIEEDAPYLKAYVEDQGPGLPLDFQASEAFKLFAKGKAGGGKAGLGLYFCRATVERWGGTIGCETVVPHGARFWFRLLASKDSAMAVSASSPRAVSAKLADRFEENAGQGSKSSLRVLLAEDDPAIRELTELLLKRQGHKVVAVATGADALRRLESGKFDVVLLDDQMPRLSGAETAKRIRSGEKPGGRHQFILSLSGNNSEADQRRLMDAGVDACLSKPFHADELNRALARFSFSTSPLPETTIDSNGEREIDPQLLQRVGGDAKLLRRVITTFLEDYPKNMRELRGAIQRKDAAALAAAAHALKGSVSIFDTANAGKYAQELQDIGRDNIGDTARDGDPKALHKSGHGAGQKGQLSGAAKSFARLEEEIAKLEKKLRGYTADISTAKAPSGKGKGRVR